MDSITMEALIDQARRCGGPRQAQIAAIDEICRRDPRRAVSVLVDMTGDADELKRSVVAEALGRVGSYDPEKARKALLEQLTDSSRLVRSDAADALGMLRDRHSVAPLVDLLLGDPDKLVRACAAEALGNIGDKQAVPALLSALHDKDEAVRCYAANALGLLGDCSLLAALATHLAVEPSPKVRAEVHGARYRLGSAQDLDPLLAFLAPESGRLVVPIFNILMDLAGHGPAMSSRDAARVRDAVIAVGERQPLHSRHGQQIINLLSRSTRRP